MINPITPVIPPSPIDQAAGLSGTGRASAAEFGQMFRNAMETVSGLQQEAHASAGRFLAGEQEDVHKVALDMQRAHLSFDLFMQVRNKAVQAYQEIMRMQV